MLGSDSDIFMRSLSPSWLDNMPFQSLISKYIGKIFIPCEFFFYRVEIINYRRISHDFCWEKYPDDTKVFQYGSTRNVNKVRVVKGALWWVFLLVGETDFSKPWSLVASSYSHATSVYPGLAAGRLYNETSQGLSRLRTWKNVDAFAELFQSVAAQEARVGIREGREWNNNCLN